MFHEVNILHLLNHPLVRDDDILTQWPSPTAVKMGRDGGQGCLDGVTIDGIGLTAMALGHGRR